MKPSIGRIVHWMDDEGVTSPAIITAVEPLLCLSVFKKNSSAIRLLAGVLYSETPKPDHWSWPPRI